MWKLGQYTVVALMPCPNTNIICSDTRTTALEQDKKNKQTKKTPNRFSQNVVSAWDWSSGTSPCEVTHWFVKGLS